MNEHEIHDIILKQVCKEISEIAEKIRKNGGMSEQDLDKLDKLYHTKKDMLATWGMEHPEEYYNGSSGDNMSGYRGRSPMTGRYVSREGSYEHGYDQGYSNAMEQMRNGGNSGHFPYPYPERNW